MNAWGEGDDSFAADPPNANLSILSETDITNVVVVLTNPSMTGEGMSYSVEILEGDLPTSGGPSALFIDVIGRPLSPVSVGGMHRRTAVVRAGVRYGLMIRLLLEPWIKTIGAGCTSGSCMTLYRIFAETCTQITTIENYDLVRYGAKLDELGKWAGKQWANLEAAWQKLVE